MTKEIKQRIEQIKNGEVPQGYKKTKIGIVPNEWEETTFGKISQRTGEKKSKENLKPYSISNIYGFISQEKQFSDSSYNNLDKTLYKKVLKGEFAYNPARINVGSIGLLKDQDAVIISSLYVCFKLNSEKCFNLYFEKYFKSYRFNFEVVRNIEGSVREYLFYENFCKIKCSLPSIQEQQKIADILSTQDKVIELKVKLLKEKEKQKKYLMQNLLTGRKRLKGFNGEWKKVKLGEICYCLDNLRKPLNANERIKIKGNYPYYGANGVVDYISDYIFETDIILLAEDGGNFEQFETKPIAIFVDEKCWVNNHAHILKAKEEHLNLYIFYSLQHKDIRKYINGTTRTKLTKSDMEEIILEISMDIEEQKAIAEILTTADKELKLLQEELEEEKRKKKALMQLLLTGIVRVKV